MNETEYLDIAEDTIAAIQDAIDDSGADIDYEEIGGVLTLEFENGAKIIFSKQAPVKQLWMAAPTGGFHFDRIDDRWVCDSGDKQELYDMLNKLASDLCGEPVELG